MSKKDYELIARVLKASRPTGINLNPSAYNAAKGTWGLTVALMADLLQINEPKFNRKKFEKAVGI